MKVMYVKEHNVIISTFSGTELRHGCDIIDDGNDVGFYMPRHKARELIKKLEREVKKQKGYIKKEGISA